MFMELNDVNIMEGIDFKMGKIKQAKIEKTRWIQAKIKRSREEKLNIVLSILTAWMFILTVILFVKM